MKSIDEQDKWTRICSCGREIVYSSRRSLISSLGNQKNTCRSCSQEGTKNRRFGKPVSEKNKLALSKAHTGNTYFLGCSRSNEFRKELSKRASGNKYKLGYVCSEETKEKFRNLRLNQIESLGYKGPAYNKNACLFIDSVNQLLGLNLQHALNGGEIKVAGYSLDGYDKDRNVVLEYDEYYHRCPTKKTADIQRQNRIIAKINPCLFLRFDEKSNRLYDAETNSTIPIICQKIDHH